MALIVPNTADLLMLQYITSSPVGGIKLKLFKNNMTPSKTTVIGDLTESTEDGYASVTLSAGTWTFSSGTGQNVASYPLQEFTFTAAASVYGFYLTTATGDLLCVEKFTAAYSFPVDGGVLGVIPKLVLN